MIFDDDRSTEGGLPRLVQSEAAERPYVVVVVVWISLRRPQPLSVGDEEVWALALVDAVEIAAQGADGVPVAVVPEQGEDALGVESRRFVMKTTPREMDEHSKPVERVSMDDELFVGYGIGSYYITRQDIEHLLNGGAVVVDDGEYNHIILFKEDP